MNDTETAQNIVFAVRQLTELYKQISLLLTKADELMIKSKWKPCSNQCVGGSNSLKLPMEWLPSFVFRMYYKGKRVAFVTVILDYPYGDAKQPVAQPLLSAGWYDYGKNRRVKRLTYDWTWCHLDFANRKDDGTFMTTDDPDWLETERWKVMRFSSFALPLISLKDDKALEEQVVQPLLDHVNKVK